MLQFCGTDQSEKTKNLFLGTLSRNTEINYPDPYLSFFTAKLLTLRLLMSYIYIYIYIYGAPILDVSRSHNDTPQSVGLLWTSDQLMFLDHTTTHHSR